VKPLLREPLFLLLLVICAVAVTGCGKKGPPLPPLARVPQAPIKPAAVRVGNEVYLSFGVPATNTSGQAPADITSIDVYAFTGTAPPAGPDPTKTAVKIGSYGVVPPPPLPAPPREGEPPPPPPPPIPAFIQGAQAVVREALTPEVMEPTLSKTQAASAVGPEPEPYYEAVAGPLVPASDTAAMKRFYVLIAQGPRGRASSPTAAVSVPLNDATSPPSGLALDYTEKGITLKWSAAPDAHLAPAAPEDKTLLASKPLTPPPPATTYHVFDAPRTAPATGDMYQLQLPTPLSQSPVASAEFSIPGAIEYGVERCFVVRPVDTIAGAVTLGGASEPGCVTPRDTFPPAPPQRLAAIAGVNVINLIWEPNSEPDLAGYIVLRGTAPGDMLQAITPTPIRETTYRDQSVRPGERYVYAVVAVDNANPQNVSGQSNRVEESSRAPR
jgi:predicted small lipoprotein YifL